LPKNYSLLLLQRKILEEKHAKRRQQSGGVTRASNALEDPHLHLQTTGTGTVVLNPLSQFGIKPAGVISAPPVPAAGQRQQFFGGVALWRRAYRFL
jgi:hypothetical protein